MPRKRLLWQLFPSYIIITFIALLSITWYFTQSLQEFSNKQAESELEARARLVKNQISAPLENKQYEWIDSKCKTLGKKVNTRITVILPNGTVVGESDHNPEEMENHAGRPEIQEAYNGHVGISTRYSDTLKKYMKYVAVPIQPKGELIGVIRTSFPVYSVEQSLRKIFAQIGLGVIVIAILAVIMSLFMSRRISKPLEKMKQVSEYFAHGELEHRLPIPDTEEIGSLAEAMNKMASELDERIRTVVQQRNEHEAILSSMVEGVLAVDNEGNVINLNQAASKIFNIFPSDADGKHIQEIVRNVDLHQLIMETLSSDQPIENEIVLRDTNERYLHVHGAALRDAAGNNVGGVIVFNDVTHIRRLEKLRSDFVANVSHELKTPITSIKGFVETLLEGAIKDEEDAERFLHIIAKQTDRLNAIIEDLLSLSRIEQDSSTQKIPLKSEQLKRVLRFAVEDCEDKAKAKQIQMELDCPDHLTAKINSPLLEQAVVNLIDNAIKYSETGKTIRLEAAERNNEISISVHDQGCGIEEEHLSRIFERFYRVDKARSRQMGGTGLGLSIVKHIARTHQGTVTVESTPKVGSTFTIHLPKN